MYTHRLRLQIAVKTSSTVLKLPPQLTSFKFVSATLVDNHIRSLIALSSFLPLDRAQRSPPNKAQQQERQEWQHSWSELQSNWNEIGTMYTKLAEKRGRSTAAAHAATARERRSRDAAVDFVHEYANFNATRRTVRLAQWLARLCCLRATNRLEGYCVARNFAPLHEPANRRAAPAVDFRSIFCGQS